MSHRIQCQCGAFAGEVNHTQAAMHAICYCTDCRAYAIHLEQSSRVLDALGGTEVIATQGRYIAITQGVQHLACLSLSPRGILRWYTSCCKTPIANTARDWRMPFVGLVHTALKKPLGNAFPPVQMYLNTQSALGEAPTPHLAQKIPLLRFAPKLLLTTLTGKYKQTPFFTADGAPRVNVTVLSVEDRKKASSAARLSNP